MTPSRYFVARIAQAFGYVRKTHRMAEAASESHLLREAETYLGVSVWEQVEPIDALSVEYWNLRKLIKERDEVEQKVVAYKQRLDAAHEERAALLNGVPAQNEGYKDERAARMAEIEELVRRQNQLVVEARDVRRLYTGMKTKLEFIQEERGERSLTEEEGKEIAEISERLSEIRMQFALLKQQRVEIGLRIEECECLLDEVDERIAVQRQERREQAAEAFQVVAEMNKELSQLRAEAGLIEVRMRLLYSEIGRYVSRNVGTDPKCTLAARGQQGLVAIMKALRKSVQLNQKLAGTSP